MEPYEEDDQELACGDHLANTPLLMRAKPDVSGE
jgi:hypothetical protein